MKPSKQTRRPPMLWSLGPNDLAVYTARQLAFFAAPGTRFSAAALQPFLLETRHRVETCFRAIRRKYFFENGRFVFSHLHGDHYAMYLYLLGNTVHRAGGRPELAQALFLLNKALHGIDAFYAVELPEIFLFIHPLGTVLGNARYRDYFIVYQNCTVGSTTDGLYPQFDEGTVLFAKSTVIGDCRTGKNVVFGANSFALNLKVSSGTTVVGTFPNNRLIPSSDRVAETYFAQ